MDYEGAVELISQLETESSESEEFTVDVLKAINNEIKLTEFPKQQNDKVATALIKSLSSSFIFPQQTYKPAVTVKQQPARPVPVQVPKPAPAPQPKPPEQKQPVAPKPIFQKPQPKPKPVTQQPAAKELSAATNELKSTMGEASKIQLPKINFNVKPKETKPIQQPAPVQVPKPAPAPQPKPVTQQPSAPKPIIQKPQPKPQPAQQKPTAQKVAAARARTFKSVLVSLPLHDQIEELQKISAGIDRKAFDRSHMKIIISEINALYEYSQTEPKSTNMFEQRLMDIRLQRLNEVIAKLNRKKGVSI